MRTLKIGAISACVALIAAASAFAADIVGTIVDRAGAPILGARVSVANAAGQTAGTAVSDAAGRYSIHDLAPGVYNLKSNGGSAVTYVGKDGMTVDWGVSRTASPIALARPGTTLGTTRGSRGSASPIESPDEPAAQSVATIGSNGNCQGDNNNGHGQGKNGNGNCDHKKSQKK